MVTQLSNEPAVLRSREAYNLIANRYESWRWYPFWRANEGPLVKEWLADKRGVGLDAGCGNAPYLADYSVAANRRILVDVSEGMLSVARKRLKNESLGKASLVQGDIRALPLKKESVDFVLCTRVLSNTDKCFMAFQEFSRVLKIHGQLLITDIHPDHVYSYTAIDTPNGRILIETYKHSIGELIAFGSAAGLRLIEYRAYNLLALSKKPDPKQFAKLYASSETPIFFSMKFEKSA